MNSLLVHICLFIFFQSCLSAKVNYRVIYVIHGDGNYLYHDNDGNAVDASERIYEQAKYVAENLAEGEVFIIFQKPAENFLFFFPKDNCEFLYFKNGIKITEKSFRDSYKEYLRIESELLRKYSENLTGEVINIFLYYGHKIPDQEITRYHSSFAKQEFGLNIFSVGIERIISSISPVSGKLDLIILSTCRNGNQVTIKALSPYTEYIIASRGDIHLSHLNSKSLIELNRKSISNTFDLAGRFAESAYLKLAGITFTEISVSVYDIKKISGTGDCNVDTGITEFYKPPEFGRRNVFYE